MAWLFFRLFLFYFYTLTFFILSFAQIRDKILKAKCIRSPVPGRGPVGPRVYRSQKKKQKKKKKLLACSKLTETATSRMAAPQSKHSTDILAKLKPYACSFFFYVTRCSFIIFKNTDTSIQRTLQPKFPMKTSFSRLDGVKNQ